jgi:hypothetical protein
LVRRLFDSNYLAGILVKPAPTASFIQGFWETAKTPRRQGFGNKSGNFSWRPWQLGG